MNKIHSGNRLFLRCCYGFAINGMAVLVIGSILPSLMSEAGLGFAAAGGMLSLMAIGNFLASFLFPAAVSVFGRRISITAATALVPISFLILTLLPPVGVLYLLMLLCGVARGSITILNNGAVNDMSENPTRMLNYLHCSFAVGAFTAPFATAVFLSTGFGWRTVIYVLAALCASSCLLYASADFSCLPDEAVGKIKQKAGNRASFSGEKVQADKGFLKIFDFYGICFLLFLYVGIENCINGWFVTYLQSTGIVTEAFASTLVSITWVVIMVGRIACASLSKHLSKGQIICMNCVGSTLFFFLLIASHSIIPVTLSLMGLGFCLAGIYPTCIADAGGFIKGSTFGMAILTAIAALGGIITPQIIGSIAENIGIVAAVSTLSVNVVIMVLLAVINLSRSRKINVAKI